ncbi:DNA-binding CsgD family transcriptional regulator [Luteibacter sp. Sphag1AF]|uniref:response regulator transcription factor n=1 Tax=Luteibacter sp. Sphag1AF TaxID=2587031 RepID=UPI00160902EA|nr:LuxR C-terminal-related transcriptional regulator [Luteibacter sp. Sphag1AF]MBB3226391.1 DNA-binding CsgD family transcriptional regulator [Luteibacter sp. Sphag1AF]
MCLTINALPGPPSQHTCGLAEEVFAASPLPCLVWRSDAGDAVMVNAAFEREFGVGQGQAGPAWLSDCMQPSGDDGECTYLAGGAPRGRYRVTRQTVDLSPTIFHAVFLQPLPEEPPLGYDRAREALTALRPDVSLTPRETQVLDGIMRGKLNKVIAGELNISQKTVELHRANLMAKLRVHNVVELTRAVLDTGLNAQPTASAAMTV